MSGSTGIGAPFSASIPRSGSPADQAANTSREHAKAEKSARDFEAILLGSWLQSAEETFAKVPGTDEEEEQDSGGAQFMQIAMQSLGTSLAGSGGIGIAKLIAKHLESAATASAGGAAAGKPPASAAHPAAIAGRD